MLYWTYNGVQAETAVVVLSASVLVRSARSDVCDVQDCGYYSRL